MSARPTAAASPAASDPSSSRPLDGSLRAYPNIAASARMLGISSSTLSRRADLQRERRGERDVVISPREVMRLAGVYRQRSVNDVAQDLIDYAESADPAERGGVEAAVEEHFREGKQDIEREQLRWLARRHLTGDALAGVEGQLGGGGERTSFVGGYAPDFSGS